MVRTHYYLHYPIDTYFGPKARVICKDIAKRLLASDCSFEIARFTSEILTLDKTVYMHLAEGGAWLGTYIPREAQECLSFKTTGES